MSERRRAPAYRAPTYDEVVPFRVPLPWRSFAVETVVPPDKVVPAVKKALQGERVWSFTDSASGFRFWRPVPPGRSAGWLVVSGAVRPLGTGSLVHVRMRAPISGIVGVCAGGFLVPVALLVTAFARFPEVHFPPILLVPMVLCPLTSLWFATMHSRGASWLERRLRSVLPTPATVRPAP
jgi:hypothetical protein